jgi:hypothetical protein
MTRDIGPGFDGSSIMTRHLRYPFFFNYVAGLRLRAFTAFRLSLHVHFQLGLGVYK